MIFQVVLIINMKTYQVWYEQKFTISTVLQINKLSFQPISVIYGFWGEFLVPTQFFPGFLSFFQDFIKFFEIPWYFQVFQVYPHFSRFPRSNGNPEK